MKKLVIIITFLIAMVPALAQRGEFGPYAGVAYYVGDINPGMPFSSPSPAFGALYRYNFNQRWTARGTFIRSKLSNSDLTAGNTPERAWAFSSTVNEISFQAEVNFLPYITGGTHNTFSPYLFGGLGILFGSNDMWQYMNKRKIKTRKFVPSMPFGIGFKLSMGKHFCLAGEWGYRKTLSDDIDNLQKPVIPVPDNNRLVLTKRYNNDWYSFAGLTVTYSLRLEDPKRCSDFQNKFGY